MTVGHYKIKVDLIWLLKMSVSVAVKNNCILGEGPHWEESKQSLLYVDWKTPNIFRWNSLNCEQETLSLDCEPEGNTSTGFIIPRSNGGYVIGKGNNVATLDWEKRLVEPIAQLGDGNIVAVNDAKCDTKGRLWTGTVGIAGEGEVPKAGCGSLYSLEVDHSLKMHLPTVDVSNGIAWTTDNQTMFYTDTLPRKIYAFDYDLQNGEISNQRTVIDLGLYPLEETGLPDGMCTDTENKIWAACVFSSKVFRIDPETGKIIQTVEFPAKNITSCCFGGKKLDILYATSAGGFMDEDEMRRYPLAGSVFKVTGLGVKGIPCHTYGG